MKCNSLATIFCLEKNKNVLRTKGSTKKQLKVPNQNYSVETIRHVKFGLQMSSIMKIVLYN